MTEKELILLLKEGDHKAFTDLYNMYWKQVFNFCKLYVSTCYADEILQEVFTKLWTNRTSVSETGNLKGYLFIITRNFIFDKYRQHMNEGYRTISLISACEQTYDDTEEEVTTNDLRDYINKLVEELPLQCKTIFNLSRKDCLTNLEIAGKLSISIKSVEASITRAIKYLKKNIYVLFLPYFFLN